jgi:hypothetical protein
MWLAAGICRIDVTKYYCKKKIQTLPNNCTDILQKAEAVALYYVTLHYALRDVCLSVQRRNVRLYVHLSTDTVLHAFRRYKF